MCGYAEDNSWVAGNLKKSFCGFQKRLSGLNCVPKPCDSCRSKNPVCLSSLPSHAAGVVGTSSSLICKFVNVFEWILCVQILALFSCTVPIPGGSTLIIAHFSRNVHVRAMPIIS